VGGSAEVGDECELVAHATLLGPTRLGRRNRLHPHATLGAPPQDRSHRGDPTELVVGDDNEFRENVTIHRGTVKGGGVTTIGSGCLLMVGAHVAHDCVLGNGVTLANYTSLGGHVHVEDGVVCGGHVAVAPFVRLGTLSFVAGGSMVERDVVPFVIAEGNRARVRALNHVGLERASVPVESRRALDVAFRILFTSKQPLSVSVERARNEVGTDPYVQRLIAGFG
jgi:UDP-N-acetylglucosamine acyltransferase